MLFRSPPTPPAAASVRHQQRQRALAVFAQRELVCARREHALDEPVGLAREELNARLPFSSVCAAVDVGVRAGCETAAGSPFKLELAIASPSAESRRG